MISGWLVQKPSCVLFVIFTFPSAPVPTVTVIADADDDGAEALVFPCADSDFFLPASGDVKLKGNLRVVFCFSWSVVSVSLKT